VDWVIHQYSDAGTVAGIDGGVDSNDFNGDLADLMALTVAGGGECGDGTCDPGENPDSCPDDCPPCLLIPPEGAVLDELGACFYPGGDPGFWREESSGWQEHHLWTVATAAADPANYGIWELHFEQAGSYELEVYIEPGASASVQSAYQISHAGLSSLHTIDQSSVDGWISLGVYSFADEGSQSVRLDDNTGEDWELDRALVFDAIRLSPLGGGDGGESGENGESGESGDAEAGDAGSGTEDESGEVSTGSGGDDDSFDGGEPVREGCGQACSAGGDRSLLPLWLFVLMGSARRRRN
jgi:hypothetical protein